MRRLIILILFLGLIPSGSTIAGSTGVGEHNLLLFYSNDVLGETEPLRLIKSSIGRSVQKSIPVEKNTGTL